MLHRCTFTSSSRPDAVGACEPTRRRTFCTASFGDITKTPATAPLRAGTAGAAGAAAAAAKGGAATDSTTAGSAAAGAVAAAAAAADDTVRERASNADAAADAASAAAAAAANAAAAAAAAAAGEAAAAARVACARAAGAARVVQLRVDGQGTGHALALRLDKLLEAEGSAKEELCQVEHRLVRDAAAASAVQHLQLRHEGDHVHHGVLGDAVAKSDVQASQLCTMRLDGVQGVPRDLGVVDAQDLERCASRAHGQCDHLLISDVTQRTHKQLPQLCAIASRHSEHLSAGHLAAARDVEEAEALASDQDLEDDRGVELPEAAEGQALQAAASREAHNSLVGEPPALHEVQDP
mmetsp:Transcript_11182/g.39627  ORF Transcript_11182/g.39627 Transcript_11182/m.39627 type:complete len:352 (-) Transcript_11182:786-1841(-)